jgi:hypothetical protein
LWNPSGFPNLFYDEGVYMRRAMHVMEGLGPQEAYYYDHPYFGQIFLAGVLTIVGYPESLHPFTHLASIESIYLVPRVLMGILAVIDTIIVYKIAVRIYNRNVALLGSTLFAVLPSTWFMRMILLDSILLPFLLLSILLAIYSSSSRNSKNKINNVLILLSGIMLGLAIFTKIPAFTMIPLVAFLIYRHNRSFKSLATWAIPVFMIPLIWPIQSILVGSFETWTNNVLWQISRDNGGVTWISYLLTIIDPVLFVAGFAGIGLCVLRRDFVFLLWTIPFLVFLAAMGYANFFYWIPILPALCIAAAKLVFDIVQRIKTEYRKQVAVIAIASITVFGLLSTTLLIVTNVTSAQMESATYVANYVENGNHDPVVISNPVYSWIFRYVFHDQNAISDYRDLLYTTVNEDKSGVLIIDDPRFRLDIGKENSQLLHELYGNTTSIAVFKGNVTNYDLGLYPYTSMIENYEGSELGIRVSKSYS